MFPNLGEVLSARLLASSVGLNLVRADLELVRDKAGGGSRSCTQIARNEAEVAKCTKLKREPQAVCCPPPDGDEVSVGTSQRECSDHVTNSVPIVSQGQHPVVSNLVPNKDVILSHRKRELAHAGPRESPACSPLTKAGELIDPEHLEPSPLPARTAVQRGGWTQALWLAAR